MTAPTIEAGNARTVQPEIGRKSRLKHRRKSRRDILVTIGSIIVLLAIWEAAARQVNPIMAAPPTKVGATLFSMIQDGTMLVAIAETGRPFLLGYLLAVVVGIPLGLVIGRFRFMEAAIGWFVVAGYAIPMIALIPIFMLWFGLGFEVKVMMVLVMTVFAIIINTWDGVHNVPRSLIEVATAFNASSGRTLWQIILPSVIPSIMTGLRIGVGKAVIGIIIAEFFTALGGLGGIIVTAGATFQPDRMFATVIVLSAAAVGMTWLVGWVQRRIAPWNEEITGSGS